MDSILLSVSAQDLLRTSKGRVLIEPLRQLVCNAATKALTVEYRYYFLDAKLQKQLHAREFADRLLHSGRCLLDLYRWFNGLA